MFKWTDLYTMQELVNIFITFHVFSANQKCEWSQNGVLNTWMRAFFAFLVTVNFKRQWGQFLEGWINTFSVIYTYVYLHGPSLDDRNGVLHRRVPILMREHMMCWNEWTFSKSWAHCLLHSITFQDIASRN